MKRIVPNSDVSFVSNRKCKDLVSNIRAFSPTVISPISVPITTINGFEMEETVQLVMG